MATLPFSDMSTSFSKLFLCLNYCHELWCSLQVHLRSSPAMVNPAAIFLIHPLAWELCATQVTLEIKAKKIKIKKMNKEKEKITHVRYQRRKNLH